MRTLIDGGDRNSSMSSRPSGSWVGLWQALHVANMTQVQPSDARHNEVCVCECVCVSGSAREGGAALQEAIENFILGIFRLLQRIIGNLVGCCQSALAEEGKRVGGGGQRWVQGDVVQV